MPKRTRATTAAVAYPMSPATSMDEDEVQSSFEGDDVEGSVASSSTRPSAAKRQRKALSSSSTASSTNTEKDQRKTARKERNRISAQLSRDRKKNERSELESRIAATEARNLALEEENRQLRERVQQSQAMEAQLHLLQKRFEELEKVLSSVAKPVEASVGSDSGEGQEVREDSRIGSETHAKDPICSSSSSSATTTTTSTTPTTFNAPLLHQPQPQSYLSFDFLESLEAQQHQTPSSSSSMSSTAPSSVSGSSLDQAFLLPSPTLPAPSLSGQAGAAEEEEGDFSHLFKDDISQDLLNFDFSSLQFPALSSVAPAVEQTYAPNVQDDLFFGYSYDSLMSNSSILV